MLDALEKRICFFMVAYSAACCLAHIDHQESTMSQYANYDFNDHLQWWMFLQCFFLKMIHSGEFPRHPVTVISTNLRCLALYCSFPCSFPCWYCAFPAIWWLTLLERSSCILDVCIVLVFIGTLDCRFCVCNTKIAAPFSKCYWFYQLSRARRFIFEHIFTQLVC